MWGTAKMTTAITKESLAARIAELESGARSLKEDYTLAAYKMLLATMEAEPAVYGLVNPRGTITGVYSDEKIVARVANLNNVFDPGHWVIPLHADPRPARPSPVVPDLERLKEIYSIFCTPTTGSDNALSAIHNACRAAMLNPK